MAEGLKKTRERLVGVLLTAALGTTACTSAEKGEAKPIVSPTSTTSSQASTPRFPAPYPPRREGLPNVVPVAHEQLGPVDKQWTDKHQKPVAFNPDLPDVKYVTIDSRRTGNPEDPTGLYSLAQQDPNFAVARATNGDVLEARCYQPGQHVQNDEAQGTPDWVRIKTGLSNPAEALVPAVHANFPARLGANDAARPDALPQC